MLASILLPLADLPQAAGAWDRAFWLAGKGGGHIQALGLINVRSFEIPVLGTADGFMPSVVSPPMAESQALLKELTQRARDRVNKFAAMCALRGVSCSTDIKTGIPGEVIAHEAAAHDLVVLSRFGYERMAQPDDHSAEPLVSSVIRGSVRPVLVAGNEFPASGALRRMIVAYDGSGHAARALAIAVELAGGFGIECVLATIAPSEAAAGEVLAPAEAYLLHHGVTPVRRVAVGAKPADLLCDLVGASGSELLVMGAYGHSPIREMLFGSTTERVLSHCKASVILLS